MDEILGHVAHELDWLDPPPVFVGGAIVHLYLIASPQLQRATLDVDLIVPAVQSQAGWLSLQRELHDRGWQTDPDVRHIVRYISPIHRIPVDFMAEDPSVLGFAGRWYPSAVRYAREHRLRSGTTIRIPSASCLLACKLEAYRDRGIKDPWTSTDLEDIVTLLDGCPSLLDDAATAEDALRAWLAAASAELLADPGVLNYLSGYLSGGDLLAREARLRRTLSALAA